MLEAAPLIETLTSVAPPGAASWFEGAGGARLRAALFAPAGRPRGSIVLSGGRTEPIEKYYETISDLVDRGFVVLAHDWRGQGLSHRDLSDRLKGHARGYNAFLDDFGRLLDTYEDRLPKPWVALGHSMGGCLTLLALARGEARFVGAILSAPMLGVQTGGVAKPLARALAIVNVALGRGGRYALGNAGRPFDDNFDSNALTHDRARFARNVELLTAEPKLALGAPTYGWLDFAFRAIAYLARPEHLRAVTVPVTIVSAEDDKLVDNAAQEAAARHLPQGRFLTVPGAFHEILMETDAMRNIFLRALDVLTGRVAPKPAEALAPAPTPMAAPAAAAPAAPEVAPPKPATAPAVAKTTAAKKPAVAKKATAAKAAPKPAAAAKPAAPKPAAAAKPAAKVAKPKAPAVEKAPAAKTAAAPKAAPAKAAAKPAAVKTPAAKPVAVKAKATPAKAAPVKVTAKKASAPKAAAAKPPSKAPPKAAAAAAPAAIKAVVAKPAAKPVVAKAIAVKKPPPKTPVVKKPAARKPAAKAAPKP